MEAVKPTNIQELIELVNETCECDILKKSRLRKDVDGRMIFAQVLHSKGLTKSAIGRIMNKNHATIVYYIRKIEGYLRHDEIMRNRYHYVSNIYSPINTTPHYYQYSRMDLMEEIRKISSELERVNKDNTELRKSLHETKRKDIRLSNLYRLVKERTPLGREQEIERKLTHIYNGVDISQSKSA